MQIHRCDFFHAYELPDALLASCMPPEPSLQRLRKAGRFTRESGPRSESLGLPTRGPSISCQRWWVLGWHFTDPRQVTAVRFHLQAVNFLKNQVYISVKDKKLKKKVNLRKKWKLLFKPI